MDKERIKQIAARMVLDGLRRSAALTSEAWREYRLAQMLPRWEAEALRISAAGKFHRAARIEQLCGRLAAAHGIGQKRTGRGGRPRPVQMKSTTMVTRKVAYAR